MKRILNFLLTICSAAMLSSCLIDINSVKGSGNITTENRNLSGFDKVRSESGIDVTIEQGDSFAVIVEADDNVQKHIETTIENGTLVISSNFNSFTNVTMNVKVKMPAVTGIEAHGGSSVKSTNTLSGTNLSVSSDGGSSVALDVEAERLTAAAESGSSMKLVGKALSFQVSSDSGSEIDADQLIANDIDADASSGSSTSVHAAVNLKANASSGASISYSGNPKQVTVSENSGGSVDKE